MNTLFRFFAERHTLAYLLTILVILFGFATLLQINRAQYPKVDLGQMVITTSYPGAAPEDVELNVTNKIEDELKSVTDIRRMFSMSMENVSIIIVDIEPDASDPDEVKQEIREAVFRVTDFPEEVTESSLITDIKTSIFPILEVGLTGDMPYPELRELARRFEKKLKDIPGVASVQRYGYRDREVQVEVSPDSIRELQLPIQQIITAIRQRNIQATGGSLESFTSEKNVVTLEQFQDPEEVGDVIVRSSFDGPIITVSDVATVTDGFEEERVLSRINGHPAISFLINKSESADIIRTVDEIRGLVEEEKGRLPEGVRFIYGLDFSQYVQNQLSIVLTNGAIGLLLVLVTLSLFLNIRAAFWVALGIPFTLLGTISLLPLFDVELDGVTLTSMIIVIGIVVDDAIIISENIFRRREQGDKPIDAVVNGIVLVYKPVLTTILTTFLAFAPMFFMPGMLGKFVFVIPLTISLALFVSLIEAFFVLPAHILPGLGRHTTDGSESVVRNWFYPVRDWFEGALLALLRFRYVLVMVGLLSLGGALYYGFNYISYILFPTRGADAFNIWIELPVGSSLNATSRKAAEFEDLLDRLPDDEVSAYLTRVGSQADIIPIEQENFAELAVKLTPYGNRERSADEIVSTLRQQAEAIDGVERLTFFVVSGGPPVGKPVTIRIIGSDDSIRTALADSVFSYLAAMEGVTDPERDDKEGKEQIEIVVRDDKLSRLGLTVADIAQNIRIAYDGQVVTSVRYGEEDVDFRVMLQKSARQNIEYLKELSIANPSGRLIPLSEVAGFVSGPGPSTFHHYDGERSITISAEVDQAVTTPISVMQAVERHFGDNRDFPGMKFVFGGEAQESAESLQGLFLAFGIAACGIYFLLILLFNSVTQPLLVMMSIPFAVIGIVIAFGLHGEVFSFLGLLGVVGMAGVVVNDSLVLVNYINEQRRIHPSVPFAKVVASGTADRLRAIILTTVSTAAGLLPLAYGIGGTDVNMMPMALALGWGLLFATPLTLVLIPSLYMIGADIRALFSPRQDG
ncbi:efflux RND transporter permease subunit [Prosthecochloris sp. N3]|uniref:Efflux RND transporter permease subunit n=1 Tax=Prosthecochloris ethylica TaxID=2743976 RepID=A0ABR9XQX7_9CHLB|nr:efflux RND transporter permease subunit [Prosthecochloris ethylica]MBF0636220.1 efflux RND transporter permease subunit [Prosthecochloris ethylica]NUK46664.1 efflux RND transporter permease subunit [Prosthecochloris ethylica]